jgi:hypothetical protein
MANDLLDTNPQRLQRLLEATLAELENRGWCQESVMNSKGNVCLGGAMRCAIQAEMGVPVPLPLDGHPLPYGSNAALVVDETYLHLVNALAMSIRWELRNRQVDKGTGGRYPYHLFPAIAEWNDQPTTTREEVEDVLRHAAKRQANLATHRG